MCYDPDAYRECERECRWYLERGHGPDYEVCEDYCHRKYLDCDYDEDDYSEE